MERRYITLEGRIDNALARAKQLGHNAIRVSDNHYTVYSESDCKTRYDVFVTSSGLTCNCKAGSYGRPCKHAARVAGRLQREGVNA